MSDAAPAPEASRPAADVADVAELGLALCKSLYAGTKLYALWGYESKVAQDATAALVSTLRTIGGRFGETVLRMASETLFLNDQRLRMDVSGFLAFRFVVDLLAAREIGEIRFGGSTPENEVVELLRALASVDRHADDPRGEVVRHLERAAVRQISVDGPKEIDEQVEERRLENVRETSVDSWFRSIYVSEKLMDRKELERGLEARRAKRVVHALVDLLDRDETTLLALSGMKAYRDYLPTHATNVCILSVAVGQRLGMHKALLGQLGLAALLHDAGRALATEAEYEADPAEHTRRGAEALLQGMGFDDGPLRAVLAARWHHQPPRDEAGAPAPLVHRIIAVADFFDTVTTPAGPDLPAVPAKRVLRLMARDEGKHFDRALVRVLASVVGSYPLGTIVHLDSGERGVVIGRNPHFDAPGRPVVRLLSDAEGQELADPRTVDLSLWDRSHERFVHSIVESIAPAEAYEGPAEYLKTI